MTPSSYYICVALALTFCSLMHPSEALGTRNRKRDQEHILKTLAVNAEMEPCTCGVFLSGQMNRTLGRRAPPQGSPVLEYESDDASLPCGAQGYKQCINKCLDVIVKHLPKAGPLVCSSVDRNVHREKAYLYIRNCNDKWVNTKFSAGKEFCCRDGDQVKCT